MVYLRILTVAPNIHHRMVGLMSGQWTGYDLQGSSSGLTWGAIPECACRDWEYEEKPQSGQLFSGSKSEPRTSGTRRTSANDTGILNYVGTLAETKLEVQFCICTAILSSWDTSRNGKMGDVRESLAISATARPKHLWEHVMQPDERKEPACSKISPADNNTISTSIRATQITRKTLTPQKDGSAWKPNEWRSPKNVF
jgi:hypothetical protein